MTATTKKSLWLLWVVAPLLLALSLYRPFTPSRGLAATLPTELPGYTLWKDIKLTERQTELLGTGDAAWRTYKTDDGNYVFMVAVFHEENWKSVHPPRICLEGSNMDIREDDSFEFPGIEGGSAGRIVAYSRSKKRDYVSLYLYGAEGLMTPSYLDFFWHHAPKALLRRSTSGFLLRVETFLGRGGMPVAEARCKDFMTKMLPIAQQLVDP